MECVICFHEYSTVVPLVLPCGHCFCELCVKALYRNRSLECPSCRTAHKFPPGHNYDQLPRNYALEDLIREQGETPTGNRLSPKDIPKLPLLRGHSGPVVAKQTDAEQKDSANSNVPCDNCEKERGTLICHGCGGMKFCKACFDSVHDALPAIIKKRNAAAHQPLPLSSNFVLCPEHPTHQLKLFCEEDQKLICSECVRIGGYARRTHSSITGAANRERLRLERSVSTVRDDATKLHNLAAKRRELILLAEDESKTVAKRAQEHIGSLRQALDTKEAVLLQQVEMLTKSRVEALRADIVHLEKLSSSADETFVKVSQLLSSEMSGGDVQILTQNGAAIDRLIESLTQELKVAMSSAAGDNDRLHKDKDMAPVMWQVDDNSRDWVAAVNSWEIVTAEERRRREEEAAKSELVAPGLGRQTSAAALRLLNARANGGKAQEEPIYSDEEDMVFSLFD